MATQNTPGRGTLISGTLQSKDLIPAFLGALKTAVRLRQKLSKLTGDQRDHPEFIRQVSARMHIGAVYFSSKLARLDLMWLEEALGEYVPKGCYFGLRSVEKPDYGIWESKAASHTVHGEEVLTCRRCKDAYLVGLDDDRNPGLCEECFEDIEGTDEDEEEDEETLPCNFCGYDYTRAIGAGEAGHLGFCEECSEVRESKLYQKTFAETVVAFSIDEGLPQAICRLEDWKSTLEDILEACGRRQQEHRYALRLQTMVNGALEDLIRHAKEGE